MIRISHFHYTDRVTAERLDRIENQFSFIGRYLEDILMSFEDLKAAQDATDAKIDAVKADIEGLMAKLAAVPVAGMTPEQEAALADAVAHAHTINNKLSVIDELNP